MRFPERRTGPAHLPRWALVLIALASLASLAPIEGYAAPGSVDCTFNGAPGTAPITCSAHNFAMNYRTHSMHLTGDVKIVRGDLSVVADTADATASGEDFKDSHWVFTGNVHVRTESQGELHADHTTLEIINGALSSAQVTGMPVQFEQTRSKNGSLAKGHANTVDYNVVAGTVKLTGEPWLSYSGGQNLMSAASIIYNVRTQDLEGQGESSGSRAHMTITPKSSAPAGTDSKP